MQRGQRPIWILIGFMALTTVIALYATDLTVVWTSNPALPAAVAVLFGLSLYFRYQRPRPQIAVMCETATQMLMLLILGILLSYAGTAADLPLRDAELYRLDVTMGFSHASYLSYFQSRPWLDTIIGSAYPTLVPQLALLPLLLTACGRMDHTHRFLFALGIALSLTNLIAVFVPSVSTFYYLDLSPAQIAKMPAEMKSLLVTIEGLRSDAIQTIRLINLEGLVTFPSFHTAGGLLLAWAALAIPYLRWFGVLLNAALIVSTPLVGGHYFIDLFGGAIVAAISILIAEQYYRRPAIRPATADATATSLTPAG